MNDPFFVIVGKMSRARGNAARERRTKDGQSRLVGRARKTVQSRPAIVRRTIRKIAAAASTLVVKFGARPQSALFAGFFPAPGLRLCARPCLT